MVPAASFPRLGRMAVRAVSPLTSADIDGALGLVLESGWNQVAADWQLFLSHGHALKVPASDGGIAATAATLPYSSGFAWISMVLVRGDHRRRGIATDLLNECVDRVRAAGLVPVLDATPAGREVYRQLGFEDGWPITRWRRQARAMLPAAGVEGTTVRALTEADWPQIAQLDREAFGADRQWLLRRLADRSRGFACVAEEQGKVRGYLLGRDGRVATQAGPIVADCEQAARALLAYAVARIEGQVIVDALDRHASFAQLLAAAGFTVERGYTRMALGAPASSGDPARVVAIAGPELG